MGCILSFAAPSAVEIESINLQVPEQEMDIYEEQEVILSISPEDAVADNLSFESSDRTVVDFSGDSASGKIKSYKEGEAYIYVVADNGVKSKKIKITVVDREAEKKAEAEKAAAEAEKKEREKQKQLEEEQQKQAEAQQQQEEEQSQASQTYVYIPQTGSKYHSNPNCSNMNNPSQVTLETALQMGFEPCKKCY